MINRFVDAIEKNKGSLRREIHRKLRYYIQSEGPDASMSPYCLVEAIVWALYGALKHNLEKSRLDPAFEPVPNPERITWIRHTENVGNEVFLIGEVSQNQQKYWYLTYNYVRDEFYDPFVSIGYRTKNEEEKLDRYVEIATCMVRHIRCLEDTRWDEEWLEPEEEREQAHETDVLELKSLIGTERMAVD